MIMNWSQTLSIQIKSVASVMRDVLLYVEVQQCCLKGGTHEETLHP